MRCDLERNTVSVFFRMPAAPEVPGPSVTRWLDLSLADVFQRPSTPAGSYVGVGPLPTTEFSFDWQGIRRGATHYYRINTQLASGEWGALTGSFSALPCDRSRDPGP
jgi:hypothetical protein